MSPQTATSEGQKVTLGKHAPVTQEAPGQVASDSLAAESKDFLSSNDATPRLLPHEDLTSSTKPYEGGESKFVTQPGTGSSAKVVDSAPSYVNSQFIRDTKGPHGKNITEDDDMTQDRSKNASFNEFGTKNDPARLAEDKIAKSNSSVAGSTGARQKGIDGKTPFDALKPEEQA